MLARTPHVSPGPYARAVLLGGLAGEMAFALLIYNVRAVAVMEEGRILGWGFRNC